MKFRPKIKLKKKTKGIVKEKKEKQVDKKKNFSKRIQEYWDAWSKSIYNP